MPVYLEESILALERIYINGGKRGYLVGMAPSELSRVLKPVRVKVGIQGAQ
jgi:prolyl-tRNA editing enzyme YbaK/EbsC (Cys-tRNA(Pro) deacylase)